MIYSKQDDRRKRLVDYGPEKLADTLLELAAWDKRAESKMQRMTAAPSENVGRFKRKLAALKKRNGFIDWRGSTGFARELEFMLDDLEAGLEDPRTGVELMAKFFEADEAVFNSCDDSNGTVGDAFRFNAANLFSKYASRCQDKDWICDLLEKLHRDDDYGVRDALIEKAGEYLPPEPLRRLAERFWELSTKETDKYAKRSWLILVKLLARQLKDAPLFEKAETGDDPNPGPAVRFNIAEAYLEAGDAKTALKWMESIPKKETYMSSERDHLLKTIHGQSNIIMFQINVYKNIGQM